MGSGSGRKGPLTGTGDLFKDFGLLELGPAPGEERLTSDPGDGLKSLLEPTVIPAEVKSRLIAEYLALFERVTGGGLYIDGFAAPQKRAREDAWTARRALERTRRLRRFWLCDTDRGGLRQLDDLAAHHNKPGRRVTVLRGDFNESYKGILSSGWLTDRAAIFALLDQRNTECRWSTVQGLAGLQRRYKIELLYFAGTSWTHRSLSQAKKAGTLAEIDLWWGGPTWRDLLAMSQDEVAKRIADRFVTELGYQHVSRYPIMRWEDRGQPSYHLIHASDHAEAPRLVRRAYRRVTGTDLEAQPSLPLAMPDGR